MTTLSGIAVLLIVIILLLIYLCLSVQLVVVEMRNLFEKQSTTQHSDKSPSITDGFLSTHRGYYKGF